jgi:hypothetical protein
VSTANLGAIYKINITDQGVRQVTSMFGVLNVVPAGPLPLPTLAELSLEAFTVDVFFALWIQDDDDVFEIIYQSVFSPNVTEKYVSCGEVSSMSTDSFQ